MNKIIVYIHSGMVQEIVFNIKDCKITIVDYDLDNNNQVYKYEPLYNKNPQTKKGKYK